MRLGIAPLVNLDGIASSALLGTAAAPISGLLGRKRSVRIGGVHGAAVGLVAAAVARGVPSVLVVAPDAKLADALLLDVRAFADAAPAPFPMWPHEPGEGPPDADVLGARANVLELLRVRRDESGTGPSSEPVDRPATIVVASLSALAQDVPSPSVLDAASLTLSIGATHPPTALLEHLALSGFIRVPTVESPGEFAGRGGVVDVFPFGAARAARIDFFGDTIDSIRVLEPGSQRSAGALSSLRLLCLAPERVRDPVPSGGPCLLLEHLPADAIVVLVEPATLSARVAVLKAEASAPSRARVRRLDAALSAARRLDLSSLRLGADGDLDLDVGTLDEVRGVAARAERAAGRTKGGPRVDPQALVGDVLSRLAARADRVVVRCRAKGEGERLQELLPATKLEFVEGSLSRSFLFGPTKTAYVAYDDLGDLSLRERRPQATGATASRPIQDFLELEVGEAVVHLHHGIGIFRGVSSAKGPSGSTDAAQSLKIEFAEGTVLFVPVARIDLVQRYIGTGKKPHLSTVGGTEWAARKAKVEGAVEELAQELLVVQAMRSRRAGPGFTPHPHWQDEFERAFPWKDTADQVAATIAVKADLAGPRPMDRLLCGDVGYGKTEVALRAAFLVATSGRQVAVLVPTTVLAEQHLRTFEARLASYPLVVRALSRFRTPAETREIVAGLADGTVDVVVGTHRLLSKDVSFSNLGLVVVDEEQRFGVKHKERLKALRGDVDVLTLSATPIPRTLHMALLGIRDISNLTTPPPGRLPIETKLARYEDGLVRESLQRELDRGGQAYVIHNRVFDLEVVAGRIMRLVPDAKVAVIHGQMDRDLVEERMVAFVQGDVDVLVATTIVESGLDIPNSNSIVIHNADRFGLAELHQLRGRVGREQRHAHCLLLVDPDRAVSEEAARRLRALEEYSELGAGFRIAMRDLELRGAGNLLGSEQSGHIAAVGYDLYCRLLADAVRRVKHEVPRFGAPATLDVELSCGIPETYVREPRETFRLFRRVSTAPSLETLETLNEEFLDRFGPLPPETGRLFLHQAVRLLAGDAGIVRIRPAEAGGLALEAPPETGAIDRLALRGLPLRRLDAGRAYLAPPEGAPKGNMTASLLASLEALRARLLARPTDQRAPVATPPPRRRA